MPRLRIELTNIETGRKRLMPAPPDLSAAIGLAHSHGPRWDKEVFEIAPNGYQATRWMSEKWGYDVDAR